MSVRAPMFVGALLLAGCGLVSGLDSLGVEGGTPLPDATPDVGADVGTDAQGDVGVTQPPDASPGGDAAPRAGTALQSKGGCATAGSGATLSLTNDVFTIELWFRLDAPSSGSELDPVLWKGGRATSEPGWSLVVAGTKLVFCISDPSGSSCTTPYALTVGHLVHLGIRSTYASNTLLSRSVNVYARDVTAGELAHTSAGSLTGGVNSWTSNAPFTVGGAMTNNNLCTTAPAFTIDDVRVYTTSQSIASMDTNESVDVSCSLSGLIADYKFNEGTGTGTKDCTSAFDLTLGQGQTFVPSPFP